MGGGGTDLVNSCRLAASWKVSLNWNSGKGCKFWIPSPSFSHSWRHQMETLSALLAFCIHRSPVNSPYKGQRPGDLMFSLICAWINGWVNNVEADDLRCHHAHYDITAMLLHQRVTYLLYIPWNMHTVSTLWRFVAAISQTTLSSASSCIAKLAFCSKGIWFHRKLLKPDNAHT